MKCLFFATVVWTAAVCLHAGGAKEDQIQIAKQYIEEKRYDEAINILSEAIKNDPERMDEAHALMNGILAVKGGYNQVLQGLVDTLNKDPGNYNKALELINQMSNLDPNPSTKIKSDIEGFRITAKLNKVRFDKNQIMAKALEQLQAKDYVAAIDTYLGGFSLSEDDFKLGTQTDAFKAAMLDRTAAVRTAVNGLKTQNAQLIPALQSFAANIQAGKAGMDRLSADFPAFAAQFLRTVSQTAALEQASDIMTELRQRSDREYPPENANYNYNEYIRIIQELMQGPAGKTGQGIRFAARTLLDIEYRDTLASLQELYAARRKEFEALALGPGDADLAEPARLVQLAGGILLRAQGLQGNVDLGAAPSFADITAKLPALYRSAPALVLAELRTGQQLLADAKTAAALRRLKASKTPSAWSEALQALDASAADLVAWERDLKAGADAGLVDQASQQRLRTVFLAFHEQGLAGLLAFARENYGSLVQSQLAQVRNLFTLAGAEEKKADILLVGATQAGQSGVYRYPDQALAAYNATKTKYLAQLNALDLLDKDLASSRAEIGAYKAVQDTKAGSAGLRRDIQAAIARLDLSVARCQSNLKTAQENTQKAVQALGLADAAIAGARPDLVAADRNFTQASELYMAAFSLAYNADQRLAADARLNALRDRIETARNNEFNRQIRELVTVTKASFDKEEYQRAFDTVSQAEELDNQTAAFKNAYTATYQAALAAGKTAAAATTEATDSSRNAEIRYWKNRIQAATNLSGERTISEADPTFFALANYLNLAQIDYTRLAEQADAGRKADTVLVTRATQNINNVLLVKPNNGDAKLLLLKVEQIADPAAFKARLPNRVKEAIDRARKSTLVNDQVKALTDLNALLDLSPGNQSLKDAIFNLEVALGYRDSPLTTAKKNEAAANVARARQLAASSKQADLQQAVALLNKAFALNPENADIGPLLDKVRAGLKDQQARLTFEEEQKLNEARSQYLAHQYLSARTTVQALLNNHPTMAPLVKLLGQIDQALGLQ
jgi:hypothetical protein